MKIIAYTLASLFITQQASAQMMLTGDGTNMTFKNGASVIAKVTPAGNIEAATPTANNHVATKEYVDTQLASASGGSDPSVKYGGTWEVKLVTPSRSGNYWFGAKQYCKNQNATYDVLSLGHFLYADTLTLSSPMANGGNYHVACLGHDMCGPSGSYTVGTNAYFPYYEHQTTLDARRIVNTNSGNYPYACVQKQ